MKRYIGRLFMWLAVKFRVKETRDHEQENVFLRQTVAALYRDALEDSRKQAAYDRVSELIEARQMAGTGPWIVPRSVIAETDRLIKTAAAAIETPANLREVSSPIVSAGATGDIELALQNVEWRREVNLSWLEFSRWGIQQIILISRLHYIKNPWIQRGINVVASYIFGRGVEVMSEDDDANDVLHEFFERNKKVLGQAGLSDLQKRLMYDGQVFFCFFADKLDTGKTSVRTIDATEVFEIICNPDDSDEPWFYHRKWTIKVFDPSSGSYSRQDDREAYYPALSYVAKEKPETINGKPVMWDTPVLHHRGGTGISKWHFDCPKVYAALDWAKTGRTWLEACATVRKALSQIALTLSTKGGQQALEGAKQQLGTTVGPTSSLWDKNPPAVDGGIFASGPGTTLSAFNTKGAGGDPSDVKEYRNMVACVLEIPPTWLGDMETSNLSTAQTLDRPTELGMLEKQERWREVLITIAKFVLNVDQQAESGMLKEAGKGERRIVEMSRVTLSNGTRVYVRMTEAARRQTKDIAVKVIFPAIREGDVPANITAIAEAMTLGNTQGQVVGIDEKVGVGLLYEQLGVEDAGEILDDMYPDPIRGKPGKPGYEIDRTKEPPAPPKPATPPVAAVPRRHQSPIQTSPPNPRRRSNVCYAQYRG